MARKPGFFGSFAKILDILGFIRQNVQKITLISSTVWENLAELCEICQENCQDFGQKCRNSKNFCNKKTKMPGTGRLQDKRTVQQNQNSSKIALPIRRARKFGIYKKSFNEESVEKFSGHRKISAVGPSNSSESECFWYQRS